MQKMDLKSENVMWAKSNTTAQLTQQKWLAMAQANMVQWPGLLGLEATGLA
jgi:hypothetical protein